MSTASVTEKEPTVTRTCLLAGLAGGMAEIAWICIYYYWIGQSPTIVAREVAASLLLPYEGPIAPFLGLTIHMTLSLALGVAYAFAIRRPFTTQYGTAYSVVVAAAVLVMIWAINFFLLLPALNPRFVSLMPYSVTLASKILFGLSMGWVLRPTYAPDSFRTKQPMSIVVARQ